ncbi:hypothetical protein CMK18_17440 [Candidatus Poribacteria bacterium]|nr:hypothetical protein [Candidatus Poribacteria bacterium]
MIRTYHAGLKDFPEYMLFNIENDPHKTINLAGKKIEILGHGFRLMDQWMSQQMNRSLRGDPFWGVIQEGGSLHANEKTEVRQKYIEKLRTTGHRYADNLDEFGVRPFRTGLEI